MTKESYSDYMIRKIKKHRELKIATLCDELKFKLESDSDSDSITESDILKREIFELQKGLNISYITIKEMKAELTYYKNKEGPQLEFKF